MGERNMANGAMKSFKTVEELIAYFSDEANIATLDSGEFTLKDWFDLSNSEGKYKKNYDLALKDKRTLQSQKGELEKQVAELTEQLDSTNSELAGLKEVHQSGDKEAIQKLNKEKSELIAKVNASESKLRDVEKQIAQIPELEKQIDGYKTASNRSRILDAVRKAAVLRKVPQHIIEDTDFERIVVDDFIIDETGHIFTKGESPQSVDNYIAAKQKEKPHWTPPSQGGAGAEQGKSMSDGGTIPDEHMAIMGLLA